MMKVTEKIFGVGPKGAFISLLLLFFFIRLDIITDHPTIINNGSLLTVIGTILMTAGIGLHVWSFRTLRNWWRHDKLCTTGPFHFFRHPMYAAWITFVFPGMALVLNSWIYVFWVISLHPVWHRLVTREEAVMTDTFGDIYTDYAKQTNRFIPNLMA